MTASPYSLYVVDDVCTILDYLSLSSLELDILRELDVLNGERLDEACLFELNPAPWLVEHAFRRLDKWLIHRFEGQVRISERGQQALSLHMVDLLVTKAHVSVMLGEEAKNPIASLVTRHLYSYTLGPTLELGVESLTLKNHLGLGCISAREISNPCNDLPIAVIEKKLYQDILRHSGVQEEEE